MIHQIAVALSHGIRAATIRRIPNELSHCGENRLVPEPVAFRPVLGLIASGKREKQRYVGVRFAAAQHGFRGERIKPARAACEKEGNPVLQRAKNGGFQKALELPHAALFFVSAIRQRFRTVTGKAAGAQGRAVKFREALHPSSVGRSGPAQGWYPRSAWRRTRR
ncbi:hypothetical protein SDC9_84210 [bioreactor metagenome]|uniref:Uncharacterized protein n=1 Tax=bioreactor metagenome TaxID=1076179 RepID=A0A644Z9S6_9ZZZZ